MPDRSHRSYIRIAADALTQIASLALKSSNAVLLKGGREAEQSNRALFDTVQTAALRAGIPSGALALLESREEVNALLKAEGFVDLIIPRGSNALVRYIQQNTDIPVLGHAEGICHIYVDEAADLEKAASIVWTEAAIPLGVQLGRNGPDP